MSSIRIGGVIAAALLACACATSQVMVQAPLASMPTVQKVLTAAAQEQGLTVTYATASYAPGSAYQRTRLFARAVTPDEAMAYTVEVNDMDRLLILRMADPKRAASLCYALQAAGVSFEVERGADLAPGCASQ